MPSRLDFNDSSIEHTYHGGGRTVKPRLTFVVDFNPAHTFYARHFLAPDSAVRRLVRLTSITMLTTDRNSKNDVQDDQQNTLLGAPACDWLTCMYIGGYGRLLANELLEYVDSSKERGDSSSLQG